VYTIACAGKGEGCLDSGNTPANDHHRASRFLFTHNNGLLHFELVVSKQDCEPGYREENYAPTAYLLFVLIQ
jgi:hypothetical protein